MKIVFQIDGGMGKCIAATAVCKAIKRQFPEDELIVISGYPEVFFCNPNVDQNLGFNDRLYFYRNNIKGYEVKMCVHNPHLETDFIMNRGNLIDGGEQNTIYNSILGGQGNVISSCCHSTIGGGQSNCITAVSGAVIGGGANNCVDGNDSFVGAGGANLVMGFRSSVITGCYNQVDGMYNSIVNGDTNVIAPQTCHSFISSGINNTVSGCYASILGGINNSVTHDFSAVFGNGVSSVATDTFHVSCLNAVNTPVAGAYPSGTFMWKCNSLLGPTDKVLIIA
jgi:hypothetical protein